MVLKKNMRKYSFDYFYYFNRCLVVAGGREDERKKRRLKTIVKRSNVKC